MLGQHVQRGRGYGNVGISRSIWSSLSESVIFSLKYGIVEFSFRLSLWSGLYHLRCRRS